MRTKVVFYLIVILAVVPGCVACGPQEESSSLPTAATSNLMEALKLAPASTLWVGFSDWALLKEYEGVPDLNSTSSSDERLAFINSANQNQALAAVYGWGSLLNRAETWGWDGTDLIWEANFRGVTHVQKFREDFDLAPVLALFEQRGFRRGEYRGVTVYSHEFDANADWLSNEDVHIFHTAVLPEEKILVMSLIDEIVQEVLDTYKDHRGLGDDPSVQAAVDQLGEVAAAVIHTDPCTYLSWQKPRTEFSMWASGEELAQLEEVWGKPAIHAYDVFALGYRYEGDQPVGTAVLQYTDMATAQADSELRQRLAREGTSVSLAPGQACSEVLFTLEQASVQSSALVLRLRSANGRPRRLFEMANMYGGDMLFAVCP